MLCDFFAAQAAESSMKINGAAFTPEGAIPAEYTCDGSNISPVLAWKDAPDGAKSFALIMDDPDAPSGTWTHWVVYNMSPESHGLEYRLPRGALQGENSFGKTGYGGPCPPKGGGPHRYFFRLYSLDGMLNLQPDIDSAGLKAAMKGHILSTAETMGHYAH